jgi:hypothetical protein
LFNSVQFYSVLRACAQGQQSQHGGDEHYADQSGSHVFPPSGIMAALTINDQRLWQHLLSL